MGVRKPKSEHRLPWTISLNKGLKILAEKRYKALKLNRSQYIRQLIEQDLKERESCTPSV